MRIKQVVRIILLGMIPASGFAVDGNYDSAAQADQAVYESTAVDACTDAGLSLGLEGAELAGYVQGCLDDHYPAPDMTYEGG